MSAFDLIKNIFFILIFLLFAPPLFKSVIKNYQHFLEPKTAVALIPISETLSDSTPYIHQLHTYFKNPSIKAILLQIESHDSTPGTSESIYNEIIHLKKEYQKPIFALIENTCIGGAYLIACSTDHIVASNMAFIGGVGPNFNNNFIAKIAIDQKPALLSLQNNIYEQSKAIVISNRKLSTKTEHEWADGTIFTGKQALTLGLIDATGSPSTMVKIIKNKAIIEGEIEWIHESEPLSALKAFFTGQQLN